jgi:heptosyltransferase-2
MPEVREAIGMPLRHGELGLRTRWRVGRSLRSKRYDRSIVLPKSFKSALVPFFAGIPRRTGYLGEQRYGLINDVRPLDGKFDRPMVRRYLELAPANLHDRPAATPHPALTVDPANRDRLVERLGLPLEAPVVGLVPGAEYGPAKAWPLASFAELAARLSRSGYSVWVFGSENEREAGDAILGAAGPTTRNLCGCTRLEDAVDLLSLTPTVVSNDTGLMHVAAAVGSGLVAIFGSSSPVYTPPLTDRAEVLYLDLDCSPCFERTCPLGHYRCLRDISVDAVIERIARIDRSLSS